MEGEGEGGRDLPRLCHSQHPRVLTPKLAGAGGGGGFVEGVVRAAATLSRCLGSCERESPLHERTCEQGEVGWDAGKAILWRVQSSRAR
jgi:hypothetical protein